ncbi:hypothetical protein [Caulobacter segnis]|uniref:Uncharacterized protein n=1 Tax=Caulobacter segnis TaxID=88688 RepID=A0A2W5VF44_9CAUL|nr:hypothetical protein [Caulobacter segnis]PZR36483.1 MAG: hypothetical protein DI526_03340 [Caulobacter segnis]
MPRYNKIFAGPPGEVDVQVEEAPCNVSLTPGQLVVLSSGKWVAHATAGGRGRYRVLQDNYLACEDVDTQIAANDTGVGLIPHGDLLFYVRVATGQNLAKGDALVSNGSGVLVKGATSGHQILFWAEETYNNTSGSTQLVLVRPAQGTVP